MPFIDWSPDYSLGFDKFDDEHKKLVAIVNELHEALDKGVEQATLQRICDELVEYSIAHFESEEAYFDHANYPDKEAHAGSHRALEAQVREYSAQALKRPTGDVATELMGYLRKWLINHICHEDVAFGDFLHQQGVKE